MRGENDYRDALIDIVSARFDIGVGGLAGVFPEWTPTSMGIMV